MHYLISLMLVFFVNIANAQQKGVACEKNVYDFLTYITNANGYKWPGTIKTCNADEHQGFIIVWSGAVNGSVMSAVIKEDPMRVQFMRGGGTNLFCVVKRGGQWDHVGDRCPN